MSRRQERDFANMYLIPEEEYINIKNKNEGAREGATDITFPYVQQLNFNEAEKVSVSQRNTDASSARAPLHPRSPPPLSSSHPPPSSSPPSPSSPPLPQHRNMSTQSANTSEMRGIQTDVPAQTIIPTQTDGGRTMERDTQTDTNRYTEIPTQTIDREMRSRAMQTDDREMRSRTVQTDDREMKERATQMDEERQRNAHETMNVGRQIRRTDSRLSDDIATARLTLLNQLNKIRHAQARYAAVEVPSAGLSPINLSTAPSGIIPVTSSPDRSIIPTYDTSPPLPPSISSSIPPLRHIAPSTQTPPSLTIPIDRSMTSSLQRRSRQAVTRSPPLRRIAPPTQTPNSIPSSSLQHTAPTTTQTPNSILHDRARQSTPTPTLAETIASLGLGQYDDVIASSTGARKKTGRRPKRRPYYSVSREDRDMRPTTSRIVEIREGDNEADILAQLKAIKPLHGIPDDDVVMSEEKARPEGGANKRQMVRRRDRSRSPLRKNTTSADNSGQRALEHVLDTVRARSRNVVREIRALGEGKPISRSKSLANARKARPGPSARRSSLDNTSDQLDDSLGTPTRYPKKRKKTDDERKK